EHGERWGRFSFVGLDPFLVLRGRAGAVEVEGRAPVALDGLGILDALERVLAALDAPPISEVPLHGGAVGYLGYDVVREIERLPEAAADPVGMPDATLLFPRHVVALDHLRQTMTLVTNAVTFGVHEDALAEVHAAAIADHTRLIERLTQRPSTMRPVAPPRPTRVEDAVSNLPPGAYQERVARIQEHVLAGDTFQTVLSQRFSVPTEVGALDLYRVLRVINPSPYLYLLDLGDAQVVGSSPEALVRVSGRHVESWPIAGTRPRGTTSEEDALREEELLADAKERAEHVMLVDLARNDLGRVSVPGSVRVAAMMRVERYSHVMHLVSEVTGTLRDDVGVVDVLRATFPAGTVSGAPKVRAMRLIDELEPDRRGVYAGAVGYLDLAGNLDTCITIRTVVLKDGLAHVQAGAGIVADSVPDLEERETRHKAGAVLAALRAAERLVADEGRSSRTIGGDAPGPAPLRSADGSER
ncbi:MAG: hypothetical protein RLZZ272_1172, partial [Actinomycetota bacterium]